MVELVISIIALLTVIANFVWSWWQRKLEREERNKKIEEASNKKAEEVYRLILSESVSENDTVPDLEDRVDAFRKKLQSRPIG